MCGGYSLKKINVDIDAYYSTLNRVEINLKIKNLSGESVYVETWPKGFDRLFASRDFFLDMQIK